MSKWSFWEWSLSRQVVFMGKSSFVGRYFFGLVVFLGRPYFLACCPARQMVFLNRWTLCTGHLSEAGSLSGKVVFLGMWSL